MQLNLHMKSGKTLRLYFIKKYTIKWTGNDITAITLEYYPNKWFHKFFPRIILETLKLSQIEAVFAKEF